MKSLRTFAYAAVLTLSALAATPTPAAAQSVRGTFTLPHEVTWQHSVVPAGDYQFSLEPNGPAAILTLRKTNGAQGGFMILVNDMVSASSADSNRLVLVSRGGKSFVRSLELPKLETTLTFTVPSEGATQELALASDHPASANLR